MVRIGALELGEFPLLLAPMEDVSDPPFRAVCKEGGADLMYTEFISSEGLIREAAKSQKKLDIFEYERPVGIQLFGGNADSLREAAQIAAAASPDLIDINFGCPVKAVACRGAGAALLQDIPKMAKLTEEVVRAVSLPVTVKTRLGWDDRTKNIEEAAERLFDVGIKALTIHGRTRAQMYKGEADWSLIAKVKNNPRIAIPVFGNGDIDSPQKAKLYRERYGVDGIMIGRYAIGSPWVFRQIKQYFDGQPAEEPALQDRIDTVRRHLDFSVKWKGTRAGVFEMRPHYANYFKGHPNFKPYRLRLVTAPTAEEVLAILEEVQHQFVPSEI